MGCSEIKDEAEFDAKVWNNPGLIRDIINKQELSFDVLIKLLSRLQQLTNARREEEDLLKVNIVDKQQCNADIYIALRRLYKIYHISAKIGNSETCLTYILDRYEKWMDTCVPLVNQAVRKAVINLGGEKAVAMNLLRQKILEANPKKKFEIVSAELPRKNIILGALRFMEKDSLLNSEEIFDRRNGRQNFNGRFQSSIKKLCLEVVRAFKVPIVRYLDLFDRSVWTDDAMMLRHQESNVKSLLDKEVLKWHDNILLCEVLLYSPLVRFGKEPYPINIATYNYLLKKRLSIFRKMLNALLNKLD